MDRERASAHTSERLADLRREGSVKAAEFERLASALDEEADEVEAQYRRMERAAATLRGARKEAADLLSLLGGVLEDLVDLEETADEAEAKAQLGGTAGGETPTPTLDAGRAAEDDASARAFEAARAAAIASAASLLRDAGAAEGRSYATADRVDELARATTDVAAELVTRMECALDEEEGTRKLLERARAARGANGTLVSFGSGTFGTSETSSPGLDKASASFITGSTVDSPALLRVGGGYAGSPPKHGHALRAKMARNLEMHVRALTQRAKKAAREADLLERHLARVDRFQDESVGELELALWLLRGVDELTRREKAERLAAAKARSDKFKPSGQSVKYGKLKSIADKKRTAKKKPATVDDDAAGADEPPSPLHRHRERVQQRRRDDADLLRGFDLNGGMISAGSKPQTGSNDDTAVATVRKALAGAMESAAVLDDDGILDFTDDDDDARGVEVAADETMSTPPPSRAFIAGVHRGSALPPTPGADVSAKILNDGKTPARRPTSVERSSDVRGAEGAESAEETFHTPVTELVRASRPTPSPSPAVSSPEHKSTYILPFGKSTYKSFKRNVLGIPSKKDKGASKG